MKQGKQGVRTAVQAASTLGIGVRQVHRLIQSMSIPHNRSGGQTWLTPHGLERLKRAVRIR